MRSGLAWLLVGLFLGGIPHSTRAQSVEGRVFDQDTGRPVAEAWIAVLDSASLVEMGRVLTDGQGRFALSRIPDSFALVVGTAGYAQSSPLYFSLDAGETEEAVIALRTVESGAVEIELVGDELRPSDGARILGRVVEARSGKPIIGADVRLEATGHQAISGGEGVFIFHDVPPGTHELRIAHLSYREQARTFDMERGGAYEITVRLDPEAIELEGIDVEVRNRLWAMRMDDVWYRMRRGLGGYFLTADELEVRGSPPLYSALRSFPSVRIAQRGMFDQRVVMRGGCVAALWVDGIEVFNPLQSGGSSSLSEFLRVSTMDVEVIEVYPGAASLPPEYARPGTNCAVAVWTRR